MRAFLPARPVKKPAGPGTKARPTCDTADAPGSPLRGATSVIRGPVGRCGRIEGRLSRTDWDVGRAHLLLDQLMVTAGSARFYRLPGHSSYFHCFCTSCFLKTNTSTKYMTGTCTPSSSLKSLFHKTQSSRSTESRRQEHSQAEAGSQPKVLG